ncbi:hypothetical protein AAFF_G00300470 [Aldrovandia affinis]|uniref:Uncharacterized protein n=1 Tax=Aldrovandia affinis TaxID=143900 RepID=A0AAD7SQL6_9TELE|nr:hypothetical protein AAFF_G00300470 [Aldrovandia affinis]
MQRRAGRERKLICASSAPTAFITAIGGEDAQQTRIGLALHQPGRVHTDMRERDQAGALETGAKLALAYSGPHTLDSTEDVIRGVNRGAHTPHFLTF